jgi:hypothetical protein
MQSYKDEGDRVSKKDTFARVSEVQEKKKHILALRMSKIFGDCI